MKLDIGHKIIEYVWEEMHYQIRLDHYWNTILPQVYFFLAQKSYEDRNET